MESKPVGVAVWDSWRDYEGAVTGRRFWHKVNAAYFNDAQVFSPHWWEALVATLAGESGGVTAVRKGDN